MQQFTEFLAGEGLLSAAQLRQVGTPHGFREPMGSIAFSYGLVTEEDVDLILSEQKRERPPRPFGELATSMGILTRVQVEALVRIQQVRADMGTAEALVLAGLADHDKMLAALGRYLIRSTETPKQAAA